MTEKERIDELRLKNGWSLNYLAEQIGVSDTTVYSWYNKKSFNPSRKSIILACKAFNISLLEFYSKVETSTYSVKEQLLVEAFRKVPEEQQNKMIDIIKIFSNE